MIEVWKEIDGYDGVYMVSNIGRIQSMQSGNLKILSLRDSGIGYKKISLYKNKIQKKYFVHRLVATAFIFNPAFKKEVNHIDGDRANNRVDNLEWVTSSENTKHAIKTFALKAWGNKATPIIAKDINNGKEIYFDTMSEAERTIGTRHINEVMRGKRPQAKGYVFRYALGGEPSVATIN